jgi:outer membrane receptor protein involved in Fe transport
MGNFKGILLVSAASLAWGDGIGPAAAQETKADSEVMIGEIVVTAQRRQERAQDVPISMAVVDGASLQSRSLQSLDQVAATLPTVRVVQSAGALLYIRGIGSGDNNPLFEQSVATFVDGIYSGRARASASNFLDLARVEVLKGPQSVYFGNNAIAGVFNIVSRDPGDTADGYVRLLRNFDFKRSTVEGAYGGPVTDTLAIRVAGSVIRGDGWLLDEGIGERVPVVSTYVGRGTVVWKPTDRLTLNIKLQGEHTRQTGNVDVQIVDCPPNPAFVAGAAGFCKSSLAAGADVVLNDVRNNGPGQGYDLDNQRYSATLAYEAEAFKLTSMTGYTNLDYESRLDGDGSVPVLVHFTFPERSHQFSQELRLDSSPAEWFSYNVGAYFQAETIHSPIYYNYGSVNPFLSGPFAALAAFAPIGADDDAEQKSKTDALYASLTFKPIKTVEISVGGRQSWVKKSIDLDQFLGTGSSPYGPAQPLPNPTLTALAGQLGKRLGLGINAVRFAERSDQHFSPSAIVSFKPDDRLNFYAKYVNGFKAGGFNSTEHAGGTITFQPEYVNAYEAGFKGAFFDRRLNTSIALFYNKFRDLQTSVSNLTGVAGGAIVSVANVGGAVAKGIELESRLRVTQRLSVGLDVSLLNSRYTDYPNAGGTALDIAQGHPVISLTGQPTRYAPDYSGNFNVAYKMPITSDLNVSLDGNLFFSDKYNFAANDDPFLEQSAYAKLDATLTLASELHHWALSLIGKNLTDEAIRSFGANLPTSSGSYVVGIEDPRNVSLQVLWNF